MSVLPDLGGIAPDRMLATLLRARMTAPGGTRQPPDVLAVLGPGDGVAAGYWAAREVPGGGDTDDRFAQAVSVLVTGWARDDDPALARAGARRLCTLVLAALRDAQRASTPTPYGNVARLRVDAYPVEVPEVQRQASVAEYTAACSMIVRPPR